MPTKVVIVDDDLFQMPFYEQILSAAGFSIVHIATTGALRPILSGKQHQDASFFIVDMMMPSGTLYQKEVTSEGLYTGLFVARDLRSKFPVIPIILWTGAHIGGVREAAKEHSIRLPHCTFLHKVDAMPSELAISLRHYQRTGRFKQGFFKRLWHAVTIRPSIGGVAVDVKQLAK